MAAHRLLQFSVCLAALSRLHALHVKQHGQQLQNSGMCSIEEAVISEISLLDEQVRGCRAESTPGVDFVSFIRHPQSAFALKPGQPDLARSHRQLSLRQQADFRAQRTLWGDGEGNGSLGDDCLQACGSRAGYCTWCGDGNACCREGDTDGPSECRGIQNFQSGGHHHECVEPTNPADADVRPSVNESSKLIVWVSGYPRSGSSTLLSMVSATVDDNRAGGHTFSLFEPCHDGDQYEGWMEKKGCRQLLYGLSHCDFKGIENLWGWVDPHSSNNYTKKFAMDGATKMCQEADIVAFKTVDWGHDLKKWQWLMDSHSNMKVLDVVRDPRAIYASWKKLEPFKSLVEAHDFYTLGEICNHFALNLDFEDSRIHRVVFEDLMKSPKGTTHAVYKFLEQPFTADQEHWLHKAFNAQDCPPPAPGMKGFQDCHTFTGSDPRGDEKWRSILTQEELDLFSNSETCQRVAEAYRYPKQ